jgi:hypothetical protein
MPRLYGTVTKRMDDANCGTPSRQRANFLNLWDDPHPPAPPRFVRDGTLRVEYDVAGEEASIGHF